MERHDLDVVSLIFGILFLALASTALFDNIDLTPFEARWFLPALLIVAGVLVLVSSVNRTPGESTAIDPTAAAPFEDDEAI